MTFHLSPHSRRRFIGTTLTAGITSLVYPSALAAPATEIWPTYWALLADTHIAGDEAEINSGTNMFDNLNRAIDQILAEDPLPVGAIINGDCAYLKGLDGDYQTLRKAVQRLVEAGVGVHMTMGNHDNRGPFYKAIADQKPATSFVEGKHVAVVETVPVDLFLVDSLMQVDVVTGEIGTQQLSWLARALKQHRGKPAIVFGHHNPQLNDAGVNGIKDTKLFLDLLHKHPNVQAYCFGHTHNWNLSESSEGLNLINQPPVAYVFQKSRPNGWLRMHADRKGMKLELRAFDKNHEQHGEQHYIAFHRIGNVVPQ